MRDYCPEPRLDPPAYEVPVCPWCDAETDTFYTDRDGDICGCENCVKMVDAWEIAMKRRYE